MGRFLRVSAVTATVAFVWGMATVGAQAAGGFITSKPPQLVATAPGVEIKPLLSAGDVVGNYQTTGVMDGLGMYRSSKTTVEVVMNHELEGADPTWARVSQLTLDNGGGVVSGKYLIDGTEGFEDFCSSTLAVIGGVPYYFTGEETLTTGKGRALAINVSTGQRTVMPWFGHFEHENVVPMTALMGGGFMVMQTEDEEAGLSQIYAYTASSVGDALAGRGQLSVWVPEGSFDGDPSPNGIGKGQTMSGRFVPIAQSDNVDYASLEARAQALKAFDFVRPEDGTEAPGQTGAFYFSDTGTKNSEDYDGRIYKLQVNTKDRTKATLSVVLDSATDDLRNPDNLGSSTKCLVIQEDRNSDNRKANPPGHNNLGGYSRVGFYNFSTKSLNWVARVNTPDRDAQQYGQGAWESSGVIDASKFFGRDWWLLDVEAHTQSAPQPGFDLSINSASGEDAQLMLVKIPSST